MKTYKLPLVLAIFGLSSIAYAATYNRNPEKPIANYADADAWINGSTVGAPSSSDALNIKAGFTTTFTGDVSAYSLSFTGGETTFTDEISEGTYEQSSLTLSDRVYFYGGTVNITSGLADTPYLFKTGSYFCAGDNGSSSVTEDAVVNLYGYAKIDSGNNMVFGELAKKHNATLNVYDNAVLGSGDKLVIGSKTLADEAKTTVNFYGNAKSGITDLNMRENATLNIYGNAVVSANTVNLYNERLTTANMEEYDMLDEEEKLAMYDTRKVYLNLSESGSLSVNGNVYQYNAKATLKDSANITAKSYYLGSKNKDLTYVFADTMDISDKASLALSDTFTVAEGSSLNITGTDAKLSAKNINLVGGVINSSAVSEDDSLVNVNASSAISVTMFGALNVSKGVANTNTLTVGSDSARANVSVTDGARFTTGVINASGESTILLKGANSSLTNANKTTFNDAVKFTVQNGATFSTKSFLDNGASTITIDGGSFTVTQNSDWDDMSIKGATQLTVKNGGTINLPRLVMENEGAKIEFVGSDLNLSAYNIGAKDKTREQYGTLSWVADANGISTLTTTYADFAYNLNLDFSKFALDSGTYTFEIIAVTSNYTGMINNWVNNYNADKQTINVLLANELEDTFEIKRINDSLAIVYNHVAVIPEPSTYAAIFGALALAFVAYRRRK